MKYFLSTIKIFLLITLFGFSSGIAQSCEKPCALETNSNNVKATYQVSGDRLIINLSAKTTGWVAIGFGATKYMKDADIIMGYINTDGKLVVSNEYGDGFFSHKSVESLGGKSNIKVISGNLKEGWTTMAFSIPLNPKDTKYAKSFKAGDKMKVLIAYSSDGAKNFTSIHKYKTTTYLTLGE